MEKVTIHIRPINWEQGDVYGISMRLSGASPAVRIDWGDGAIETRSGSEIKEHHIYSKDEALSFIVTVTLLSGSIEYVNPTGGDCDYEMIDFSEAPSIKEVYAERSRKIIFDNPNLEKMILRINLGYEYDLSNCPNLCDLTFHCESNCETVDLSHCHKLESLSCWGYGSKNLHKISIANDAPLRHIEICGHNLHPSCIAAIHRIIERNGGEIVGEFENTEVN